MGMGAYLMAQLTNAELQALADDLRRQAAAISHPLLPAGIKSAIQGAALAVSELVNREIERSTTYAKSNG